MKLYLCHDFVSHLSGVFHSFFLIFPLEVAVLTKLFLNKRLINVIRLVCQLRYFFFVLRMPMFEILFTWSKLLDKMLKNLFQNICIVSYKPI